MASSRPGHFTLFSRLLALAIFGYGTTRAAVLAITHDEALTYLLHVRANWGEVVAHSAPLPSNDHLLNTLAVKATLTALPPTELALRLPALLGLALYLAGALALLRSSASGARQPVGILLLAGNPFVLDLLTVSRGYALALGLTLVALSLLLVGSTRSAAARAWLAALAAALAVAANLAFLYAFFALAAAAAWLAWDGDRAGAWPRRAGAAIRAGVPFAAGALLLRLVYTAAVVARIRRVVAGWGGERGIWRDTVASLADGTLYGARCFAHRHDLWVAGLTLGAAAMLCAAALAAVVLRRGGAAAPHDGPGRALAACVIATTAWILQVVAAHALAGTRFPLERAASALLPLFTLALVLLWETAAARGSRAPAALACAAASALALAHFAACLNLDRTYLWSADADMREAMRAVAPAAAAAPPGALRLGVSWQLEPAANFYRVTRGLGGLAPVTREEPRTGFDLYLLTGADAGLSAGLGLRRCATFPRAGTVLAAAPGIPCPAGR